MQDDNSFCLPLKVEMYEGAEVELDIGAIPF